MKKLKFSFTIFILLFITNLSFIYALPKRSAPPDTCRWHSVTVTEGVIWKHRCYNDSTYGIQKVNVLDIDLANSNVSIKPALCHTVNGKSEYEGVDSMAMRTGAIAGINGGFFCHGSNDICYNDSTPSCPKQSIPLAFLKIKGRTISYNCKTKRSVFGITPGGKFLIGHIGVDSNWAEVYNAIGAGPNLISYVDNMPIISITQEGFPWYDEEAPRTAVALTMQDHLLLVTVDGREPGVADGMTIGKLALFMLKELNAKIAMNFDGGGSTTMYINEYGVVNTPSDGSVRKVYDGLFIYPNP